MQLCIKSDGLQSSQFSGFYLFYFIFNLIFFGLGLCLFVCFLFVCFFGLDFAFFFFFFFGWKSLFPGAYGKNCLPHCN